MAGEHFTLPFVTQLPSLCSRSTHSQVLPMSSKAMLTIAVSKLTHLQTVKETVAGRPETTAEKAQRVAGEAAGTASQKAGEYGSAAASHASDIAQDAQDAYNGKHKSTWQVCRSDNCHSECHFLTAAALSQVTQGVQMRQL